MVLAHFYFMTEEQKQRKKEYLKAYRQANKDKIDWNILSYNNNPKALQLYFKYRHSKSVVDFHNNNSTDIIIKL